MVNEPENNGETPLFWAAYEGHQDVIKWWIASGREMNLGTPGDDMTDAIGASARDVARKKMLRLIALIAGRISVILAPRFIGR